MIVINPREIIVDALELILNEEQYNNLVLKKLLKENGAMSRQDKAFVTEVVNGTLRNIFYIDYVINNFSSVKTEKMKPLILSVLRSGVYQILLMNVPESAAVNESVKIVKKRGLSQLSGFCNGVLRTIAKNVNNIELPNEDEDPVKYLEIKYSHPSWLIKMWLSQFDYDFVKNLCESNLKTPRVTVMANTLKISRKQLIEILNKEEIVTEETKYIENGIKLSKLKNIAALESYKKGLFHVQDESSALAVKILDPKENETILDVCSAPGGKSILAAETMKNKGVIIARDVFEHKLEIIEQNLERLSINIVKTQLKDGTTVYEQDKEQFDKVIVDAPCSGFGLLRKKADIRLKRTGNDIDELIKIQRDILAASAEYVKKDGVLVYSTCTICKKENLGNVKWFLDNFKNYEAEDITNLLPNNLESETAKDGYINLFPNIHETDGFFIARFKRKR